jgi:Domain of unknown function (DUF4111)
MMTRLRAALSDMTRQTESVLGANLVGLYLHGSAAQDDFRLDASDVDLLAVTHGPVDEPALARLEAALVQRAAQLPVSGLEYIVCDARTALCPPLEPPFLFALSAGPRWPANREPAGTAPDLLIHFALCRQQGLVLSGQAANITFGPVSRPALAHALLSEIGWHAAHLLDPVLDPGGQNAVLNAARSVHAAETGQIVSKSTGALWWLARYPDDRIVADALARRSDSSARSLDKAAIEELLLRATRLIGAHV